MIKNSKKTQKHTIPILCCGTFCDLLMQINTKSNHETMKGLVLLLNPDHQISENSLKTDTAEYINCSKSNSSNIPFNRNKDSYSQNIINEFEKKLKNRNNKLLLNTSSFINDFLDRARIDWLIKALVELIEQDETIDKDVEFYINFNSTPTKKIDIINMRNFSKQGFILGVFNYVLTQGPENKMGKETYESWHKQQTTVGARREFISNIGNNKKRYSIYDEKDITNNNDLTNEIISKDEIAPEIKGDNVAVKMIRYSAIDLSKKDPLNEYLERIKKHYDNIKTLLYRNENRAFYDLYVCNNLIMFYRNIKSNMEHDEYETINNITSSFLLHMRDNKIIIKGTGGIGKTMFMKHILLDTVNNYDDNKLIPVFVNIRDYKGDNRNLNQIIKDSVERFSKEFYREFYDRLLEDGKILFLFDGLDEIDLKQKEYFDYELNNFVTSKNQNIFIITSREIGSLDNYDNFIIAELSPLTREQSIELIKKLQYRPEQPEIQDNFIKLINNEFGIRQMDFIENPLLLTIMYLIFDKYGEVPDKLYRFYEYAYSVLSKEHDASKGNNRQYKSKLNSDDLEKLFSEFCARSYMKSMYDFEYNDFKDLVTKTTIFNSNNASVDDILYDLTSGLCLIYEEARKLYFTHRSFQEYFTALFFSKVADKDYLTIIHDIDEGGKRWNSDNVLSMLYDMKKDTIEQVMFLPYLKEKFTKWNYEYEAFLKTEYIDLIYGDYGGICSYETISPFLNFIIHKNKMTRRTFFDDFPAVEEFLWDEYAEYKLPPYDDNNLDNSEIGSKSFIPKDYDYKKWPIDELGCEYKVCYSEIFNNKDEYIYCDFYKAIMSNGFELKKQYNQLLDYYNKLEKIAENNKNKTSFFND